jgi:hypothetical protein
MARSPALPFVILNCTLEAIVVTDQARKSAYSSRWNGLLIRAKNVSTVLEEGQPFSVEVEAEDGGKLQWQGEVSIPLGQSTGRLALSDLNLRKLWEYGEPWLAFELKDGRLLVEADYHLNWKDALNYRISNGRVGVSGVSIAAKSPAQLADTSVDFNALDINAIAVDSAAHHITVDAVTLDALAVAGWMEGNRISLQDLFTIELPASTEDKDDAAPATPWTLALEQAQLRNSGVRWRSEFTEPQLLEIQPLDASIKNLRWPLSAGHIDVASAVDQRTGTHLRQWNAGAGGGQRQHRFLAAGAAAELGKPQPAQSPQGDNHGWRGRDQGTGGTAGVCACHGDARGEHSRFLRAPARSRNPAHRL